MGGTQHKHLNEVARQIWQWCESRRIFIFASYVNSSNNQTDHSSHLMNIDTKWERADYAFNQIKNSLGTPQFDHFSTVHNS